MPKSEIQDAEPIILLLPGMSSDTQEPYLLKVAKTLQSHTNMRLVVANRRGFAGVPMCGKHEMQWGRLEDVEEILEGFQAMYKTNRVYLVGYSLGANQTQYFMGNLGKEGKKSIVRAAVAISSP